MRHANRPAGPGKPTNERRDNATAREELDEAAGVENTDSTRAARQAERDAHVKGQSAHAASGTSRNRRG